MTLIATHRGIAICQAEVPGAPLSWIHDETDAHGSAETLLDAKRQINLHFGVDPTCEVCRGTGSEDWTYLALTPCNLCCPSEKQNDL